MALTFSVIIPTYNQADFIKAAIDSVLEQTLPDFEVIVINNYSSDHTLDVVGQFKDARIQVIDYQNDGVIGASRNVGIKASKGEYVAFLDSDDTWYPTKLERVAEAIKEEPDVGLLCHDQELLRDGLVARRTQYGPPDGFRGSMFDMVLFIGNGPSTSATVISRQQLDHVGMFSEDPDLITVEDYDLWLKLSKVCRFRFIREILGTHYYHAASISAKVELHRRNTLNVLDKHCQPLRDSPGLFSRAAIRRRYAKVYYGAARQSQRNAAVIQPQRWDGFVKTLGYYARCLRTDPTYVNSFPGLALLFADLFLGQSRRKKIAQAVWGPSWRWG